jgi:hypothetical protein
MRIEPSDIQNAQFTGRIVPYGFQKVQWEIRAGEGNTEKKLTGSRRKKIGPAVL